MKKKVNNQNRICSKCNIEKPILDFHSFIKNGKKYYRHTCRDCRNTKDYKKYYIENKERENLRKKLWVKNNKELQNVYDFKARKNIKDENQMISFVAVKLYKLVKNKQVSYSDGRLMFADLKNEQTQKQIINKKIWSYNGQR